MSRTQPFGIVILALFRPNKENCELPHLSPKRRLTSHSPSRPAISQQSSPVSTRLDARAASLRAVHALCLSCWPRVHAHASKLLCALLWTCGDCTRRASVRKSCSSTDGGRGGGGGGAATAALPLGVVLAANHAAIDASTDEAVREHATRLGALVLLLTDGSGGGGGGGGGLGEGGGKVISSARATLRDVCSAVSVLRPAGVAMEQLADRALLLGAASEGRESSESEHELWC